MLSGGELNQRVAPSKPGAVLFAAGVSALAMPDTPGHAATRAALKAATAARRRRIFMGWVLQGQVTAHAPGCCL
ncbi:hypothetical protein GCM10027021_29180 [Dyella kyungheensis]